MICRQTKTFCFFSVFLSLVLAVSLAISAQAQSVLDLPSPGTMVSLSPAFNPTMIKGITIHPEDPFLFDFIVHPGDDHLQDEALQEESMKLIKYFMAALTVPEDEMWVNLSPYEKDRIISKGFGNTEMGRDLLAQDYMLKQLTASLMYPEGQLGSDFWERVYKRAYEEYGTTEVPMNTFNKVWIVPDYAVIYEENTSVFVVESRLKVMLEEDYLALEVNVDSTKHGLGDVSENDLTELSDVSSKVIREIIVPEIEREVNEGKTFAKLRQISNAVILAAWYKEHASKSTLRKMYIDRNKTEGIDPHDKKINQKIYNQYIEAFEKGVYNYVKEDYDFLTRKMIPRKYFSGGMVENWSGKISKDERAMRYRATDGTISFQVALKNSSSGSSPIVDRMIKALYVDEKGRTRIDIESVEDSLVQNFFKTINNLDLRQSVFLIGEDVRNLLVGREITTLRYYVSIDIDAEVEQQLGSVLGPGYRNMGSINTILVSEADLSVNRIMVQFLPFQTDPVINDSFGGLQDLVDYRARFIGKTKLNMLIFRFPQIVKQMVAFDLSPDIGTAQAIGDLLDWVDGPFRSALEGERLTADDKQMLAAAEAYRVLAAIQRDPKGFQSLTGKLWGFLKQWADAESGSYAGGAISVDDLFGFANLEELDKYYQLMVERRLELNERNAEERESRNLDRAVNVQELADRDARVVPSDLKPGDWVITDKHGLISVDGIRDGLVNFHFVSQEDLVKSFAVDLDSLPGSTGAREGSFHVGDQLTIYRWTRQSGRIISITEQAYHAAAVRAEQQFDLERLAMRIGLQVIRDRISGNGSVLGLYKSVLDRVTNEMGSSDEQIDHMANMLYTAREEDLKALRWVFRTIYEETNEDLVRTGILKFFKESQQKGLGQEAPFIGTQQYVTADVYFYLSTELLEKGIGVFRQVIEEMVGEGGDPLRGASQTLFPRSHPMFPYEAFSNLYFAAKTDPNVMEELSQRYARSMIDMVTEYGITPEEVDYVVPVPKLRGEYNQLMPLVESMATLGGIRVNNDLVEKTEAKSKQKQIKSLVGKGMNVADAYRVIDPEHVAGRTILLIDDHSGTGLTLDQIKMELYNAGAKKVITIALTDSPQKVNVDLEVRVRQISQDTGGGIALVQEILNPVQKDRILKEVLQSSGEGVSVRGGSAGLDRKIVDQFFIHNLVDVWATEFSGGMIDEETLRRRILKVYQLFAQRVVDEQYQSNKNSGSINLNTDPQRSIDYLRAILNQTSYDGIDLTHVEMILSDYDNTLAKGFRQLPRETAEVIAQLLHKGIKFGLITQQSVDEIRQLFLLPVVAFLRGKDIDFSILDNLLIFPASGNVAYQAKVSGNAVVMQQLSGLPPVLTREQVETIREYDLEIQPAYVANRNDGIITYYFQDPGQRLIATQLMKTILSEHDIPAKVVRNGYLRMRVMPDGLSKSRARDFIRGQFPNVASENVVVLGDNYDPEDSLSDIGMVMEGPNQAMGKKSLKTQHGELMRELWQQNSLRAVLAERGVDPREGLRGFEARIFLNEESNIYWQRSGERLNRQTAMSLLNPKSLVYFLGDGSALFVDDSQAPEAVGEYGGSQIPSDLYALDGFDLDDGDTAIYDWLRTRTAIRRHIQVVEISEKIARGFGLSIEQLREKLLSTFKMNQIDGDPFKFINFRDVADWHTGELQISMAVVSPLTNDKKGGIDLNPAINRVKSIGRGTDIEFNFNFDVPSVDGFLPEIISVRPFK